MTTTHIKELFESEFAPVLGKFITLDLSVEDAEFDKKDEYLWKPGAYVWWNAEHEVIRVGRSLENSRKRAFDHVRGQNTTANDKIQMADLLIDPTARLLLFNLKLPANRHWAAAVEIYLEDNLDPCIPSKKAG